MLPKPTPSQRKGSLLASPSRRVASCSEIKSSTPEGGGRARGGLLLQIRPSTQISTEAGGAHGCPFPLCKGHAAPHRSTDETSTEQPFYTEGWLILPMFDPAVVWLTSDRGAAWTPGSPSTRRDVQTGQSRLRWLMLEETEHTAPLSTHAPWHQCSEGRRWRQECSCRLTLQVQCPDNTRWRSHLPSSPGAEMGVGSGGEDAGPRP